MARKISQGRCHFCQQTFSKNGMGKHLASCPQRQMKLGELPPGKAKVRKTSLVHLLVEGYDLPMYWMHIELPEDASLKTLDSFLRLVWLECCGHLSAFTIDDRTYSVAPMPEYAEKSMTAKIGKVFQPGVKAHHVYDFGTTTELTLKYLARREAEYRGYDVHILARNLPPEIQCEICKAPATRVCSACVWEGRGWLCDEHATDHGCGEDMLLPVVNSPRVGMCGYTGETW